MGERPMHGFAADVETLVPLPGGQLPTATKQFVSGPFVVAEQTVQEVHQVFLQTNLAGDGAFEEVLDVLIRNAVNNRAEEAFNNQLLCFGARDTAGLEVE